MPDRSVYRRVLLKVSGEALMGRRDYGLNNDTARAIPTDKRDVVPFQGKRMCRSGAVSERSGNAPYGAEKTRQSSSFIWVVRSMTQS